MWPGVIEAYRSWLPFGADAPVVTLNEGNTPLIHAPRLAEEIAPGTGLRLYLKYEGLNPTGSFKDRGMTAAITQAVIEGAETVICASTGNTAASAAAYAARAGLRMVREITERRPIALVNSVNPWRLEGQKTGAFEIIDQLDGRVPDWHCLPVGNAGNISAYWMGYKQYGRGLPRLLGGQAAGSAPIVLGRVVEKPETIATAIRIGNPARWRQAVEALDESDGIITAIDDEDILEGWRMLAQLEGVFVEPASATGLAALKQQIALGEIDATGKTAVVVLTGHGLKDPGTAVELARTPIVLPASLGALEDYLAS